MGKRLRQRVKVWEGRIKDTSYAGRNTWVHMQYGQKYLIHIYISRNFHCNTYVKPLFPGMIVFIILKLCNNKQVMVPLGQTEHYYFLHIVLIFLFVTFIVVPLHAALYTKEDTHISASLKNKQSTPFCTKTNKSPISNKWYNQVCTSANVWLLYVVLR